MRLVLCGPQSLDELQAVVHVYFSDITNKNITMSDVPKDAFGTKELPRWIEVLPELELKSLMITIPFNKNFSEDQYATNKVIFQVLKSNIINNIIYF